jgi:tight adherence protein B
MALLVSCLAFLVLTLTLGLLWVYVQPDRAQDIVRRRVEAVRVEHRSGEAASKALLRDESLSSVPTMNRLLLHWAWPAQLRELLEQAGLNIKPGKLILICSVAALFTYLIVMHFVPSLLLALFAGCAVGLSPIGFASYMRKRRFRRFEEHFPEALDLLGRAIRSGHAFTTGLEMIAKESPEPIAGEFRTTFDEQNFGLPLHDALLNLTERIPLVDVKFFVTALLIQRETGGNLAEILDGLAHVIRDRFRIYRDVQTKTAQGRLTAIILIALPPFMMVMLGALNPSYIKVLFTDPRGPMFLITGGMLQVIGSIILWKIIHIEV